MKNKLHQHALACLILMFVAPAAHAATVSFIPETDLATLQAGDRFTLQIAIDFSSTPVCGGGFDIMFDESQLLFVGVNDDVMLGDEAFYLPPEYEPGSGLLEGWSVGSFIGLTDGIVGTVEFELRPGATSSAIELGPTDGVPWLLINDLCDSVIEPEYGSLAVTAVPLPATAWLLIGALAGLSRLRRRA